MIKKQEGKLQKQQDQYQTIPILLLDQKQDGKLLFNKKVHHRRIKEIGQKQEGQLENSKNSSNISPSHPHLPHPPPSPP